MAPPVFKTGLAANTVAGGFDSLPPPPVMGKVPTCRMTVQEASVYGRLNESRRMRLLTDVG